MTLAELIAKLEDKYIPEPNSGCWLWVAAASSDKNGDVAYGSIRVNGKHWGAHRLFWALFRGPIPSGMAICHKCDTRLCVNPDHLFLGSIGENNADRRAKLRDHWFRDRKNAEQGLRKARETLHAQNSYARGSRSSQAKIKEHQISEVFALRRAGLSQQKIADRYDVCQNTIHKILYRETWAHVSSELAQ